MKTYDVDPTERVVMFRNAKEQVINMAIALVSEIKGDISASKMNYSISSGRVEALNDAVTHLFDVCRVVE